MPTSGVTAWPLTARDIVKQAMKELGIDSPGEEPDADELEDALVRLNAMLKSWQGKANLFRETSGEVTIPGGSGAGTLPAGIRDVSTVRVVNADDTERLLFPWSRTDYLSLPNKAASGSPSAYYVSRQRDAIVLYVWPVPVADVVLKLDYSRTGETVTDGSEALDIPEEWAETVILGLASRLAPMFGNDLVDPATTAKIDRRAEALYQQMLDADRPDSYRFEAYDDCCG